MKPVLRLTAALFALFLAIGHGFAETGRVPDITRADRSRPAEAPPARLYSGTRYQSGNKRDPFLNPLLLKKEGPRGDEEESRGQPPPGIAGMYVAQIKLVGISSNGEKQTAVFQGTDKRAYFLQEGDRVFDGFVKKISNELVVVVRETKMRSGKTTVQEVTKRLRTP